MSRGIPSQIVVDYSMKMEDITALIRERVLNREAPIMKCFEGYSCGNVKCRPFTTSVMESKSRVSIVSVS